jgi:hypothetical protein
MLFAMHKRADEGANKLQKILPYAIGGASVVGAAIPWVYPKARQNDFAWQDVYDPTNFNRYKKDRRNQWDRYRLGEAAVMGSLVGAYGSTYGTDTWDKVKKGVGTGLLTAGGRYLAGTLIDQLLGYWDDEKMTKRVEDWTKRKKKEFNEADTLGKVKMVVPYAGAGLAGVGLGAGVNHVVENYL